MAYLGNDLQVAFPVYRNIDDISGSFNSATTSFALTVNGVAPVPAPLYSQQCLISVGGVIQRPDDSGTEGFRLSGGNIIFASAPTTGADFFGIILAGADYVDAGANFPSGTAAVPSITFNDDLDTGIYNSGINQLSFTTGGSERLRIDSAGQIEANSIGSASVPTFSFISDPDTGIYSPGANQLAITTSGTGRLFVASDGKVGIGTSSVSAAYLQTINGDGSSIVGGLSLSNNNTETLTIGNVTAANNVDSEIWNPRNGYLRFATNNEERLRITSDGKVGIGTSSPGSLLTSYAGNVSTLGAKASSGFLVENNGSVGNISQIGLGYTFSSTYHPISIAAVTNSGAGSTRADLVFAVRDLTTDVAPTERLRITSDGKVGIGTSSPSQALHVIGKGRYQEAASSGAIAFIGGDATAAYIDTGTYGSVQPLAFRLEGTERARIDSSGRLLVGTSTSTNNLYTNDQRVSIVHSGQNTYTGINIVGHSGTEAVAAPIVSINRSRGTTDGSFTEVANGDALGYLVWRGADGTAWSEAATIKAEADGDWTTSGDTTDSPGRLVFSTTLNGTSSPVERFRISNDGSFRFLTPDAVGVGAIKNSRNVSGDQVLILQNGSNANDTSSYYLVCQEESVANRCFIYGNGNIANANNSYGAISDLKLKENIVLASSQWNDIKSLQIRKYNFKAETGQPTHTQIGLIAQEVEEVSPGLVYDSPDLDTENNDLGTVTKSVNYSVLYMKAVKALQEAMERIEALEAKVAALEGN